jgi:hypothetical protein
MKKKLLVVGCSYSAKAKHNEYIVWSDFLEQDLDIEIDNFAEHGASNILIRRILQTKLAEKKYDYVIVQWSTIDRWDYPKTTYPTYHPFGSDTSASGYKDAFYMHYYNSYGAIMDTLDNIILAQYMLEKYNTPYTMISMGNLFEMEASIEAIKILLTNKGDYTTIKTNNILNNTPNNSDYDNISSVLKLIDFSKFNFTTIPNNYFGGGMIEFLLEKGDAPQFKFHYNTEQHKIFSDEFIKPILQKI